MSAQRVPLLFKVVGMPLFLWAYLAASVKRLHDRDRSGWWLLVFIAAPNLLSGAARELAMRLIISDPVATALLAIALALFLWGVAEMGVLPGDAGDNRFGSGLSSQPTS